MLPSTRTVDRNKEGLRWKNVCICEVFRAVLWTWLLRQITMGCCLALRCKLRSLSPQSCEDRDVCREVFSLFGKGPGLAPGCSANSSSPLSGPHSSTPSSAASWMPVWLAGVGLTSPRHQAKGAMEPLPAGPSLSKQTAGWAAGHGPHETCHYQSCIASSLPKNLSGLKLYASVSSGSPFLNVLHHQRWGVSVFLYLKNIPGWKFLLHFFYTMK